MFSIAESIRERIPKANFAGRGLNRMYYRYINQKLNIDSVDIFSEDWDNLIILDGCRYDLFEEHQTLRGQLESRTSAGSATIEFLKKNFVGRELYDTVYVTANPQLYKHQSEIRVDFHKVIHVWKEDDWDEDTGTVLPETMFEYAIQANEMFPSKRLLIHFMQPHYPFLSPNSDFDSGRVETEDDEPFFWHELMLGRRSIQRSDIWKAYADTLNRVLPFVSELLDVLSGRTVVTSDHGNMIGERAFPVPITEWGHPPGIYTEELVKVPWLVYDNGARKDIIAERTESTEERIADNTVEERLKRLGYM